MIYFGQQCSVGKLSCTQGGKWNIFLRICSFMLRCPENRDDGLYERQNTDLTAYTE